MRNTRKLYIFLLILISVSMMAKADTIYVDGDASGLANGISWENAYNTLQDALDAALASDEIWVAEGTYKPSVEVGGAGDRYQTFQMKNGVGIYGGFDGTETLLSQRDVQNNETILSGDIGIIDDPSDNCYHVFYHPDGLALDPNAILDGVTITAGNADGTSPHDGGGGMANRNNSSPTLTNCKFLGNSANGAGGGMYNRSNSNPIVTNCTFSGNTANTAGGGMYNISSSPIVTNCTFVGNLADTKGGGMRNNGSSPTVINCTFSGNSADNGGGMYNYSSSSPTLTNCTFSGNSASNDGGGMYNSTSSPTVTNCTFTGNLADYGGGMYNRSNSSPAVTIAI